jgi:hypothetical protein
MRLIKLAARVAGNGDGCLKAVRHSRVGGNPAILLNELLALPLLRKELIY